MPSEQPRAQSKKPEHQAIMENGPWKPAPYEIADVSAFQALVRGEAAPDQQQRAVKWLVGAAGTYDLSYRPGAAGERDTAFAEGKRFIGLQVVRLLNLDSSKLRRSEPRGVTHEPKS